LPGNCSRHHALTCLRCAVPPYRKAHQTGITGGQRPSASQREEFGRTSTPVGNALCADGGGVSSQFEVFWFKTETSLVRLPSCAARLTGCVFSLRERSLKQQPSCCAKPRQPGAFHRILAKFYLRGPLVNFFAFEFSPLEFSISCSQASLGTPTARRHL
jgi:hypothetical protein